MKLHHIPLLALFAMPPSCHKKAPDAAAVAIAEANDAIKEQAWKDLQADLLTLKLQLAVTTTLAQAKLDAVPAGKLDAALYTCDRLALASKELASDARAQSAIGEADAVCAYQAPLAASTQKLAALESTRTPDSGKSPPVDCGPIRDIFSRIGSKYRSDAKLAELIKRFKSACPHVRMGNAARSASSSSGSSGGGSSSSNASAARDNCKQRCDSAAFSCRSSCNYCGSCTTDKTWEWCNATCNNCRQGCEQNEKFCQASCGS